MKRNAASFLMLAMAASAFAAPAPSANERAQVPEKYKWKTADLYPNDDAWSQAKADLSGRIQKLADFQGKLGTSARAFHDALAAIFDARRDLDRLMVYALMRSDEDTRVDKTREMNQAADDLGVKFAAATSYLRPELLALGGDKILGFAAADQRLAPYKPWLDDILRYGPHTLTAPEEKVASRALMMADAAAQAYNTFKNADLPYPEVALSNGDKVRLDVQAFTLNRASLVRADRDLVFKAFFSKYKEFERTLGSTLNSHLKTHVFDQEVHKHDSCLEDALFSANIPPAVYSELIRSVHQNLPTLHRYLKLRQKMMGLDQLRYEDLYAPIVKSVDARYSAEEARQLVLGALAPLGKDYVQTLGRSFDTGWMDWMPTVGKRSGAYSIGVYGVHPYQLLNFSGLYEDVSTLAHESGHSMHTYLSDTHQPYPTHDYQTFVAEVASTLNENLLLRYMLSRTKDKAQRLSLLGSHLEGLRTTLFRQTLFAEFELRAHELAEKGEPLTGEKLSRLFLGLLKDYYGDKEGVCKIADLYGVEWAYIPHFYYNFYVYQYATSITASAKIASDMRADKSGRVRDAYLAMLSKGSSQYPIDLLKGAGVDMTTPAPFNAAIAEMNSVMDEMEKLLAEK
ncbi:MAG: oligoendopeptidase F [Elusimicrobia bacterium]|nr:oligoendopeptidase F [Elusimicrobiota bacterium]